MKKMQQNHNKILVELINKTNSQNSKKFFKELDIKVKKIIKKDKILNKYI